MKPRKTKRPLSQESIKLLTELLIAPILVIYIFLCFIPAIFNFNEASAVGKGFMIAGSFTFLALFILSIIGLEKVHKDNKKNKVFRIGSYVFVSIVYIISLLHYLNNALWGANGIVWGIVLAIVLLVGFYSVVKQFLSEIFNSEFKPMLLVGFALLAFFITLVNLESNVEYAALYLKIAFGFCYLIAIALYVYYAFLNKKTDELKISRIISLVFWASLILITFPFYVRWCGLKDDDFNTFVTVYAAVVGGGLTLAGVAWTINHANTVRQEDTKNDSKPFFCVLNNLSVRIGEANQNVYHFCIHEKDDESKSIVGNFLNTDKNCFVLKKIIIGERVYTPDSQFIIAKDVAFQIRIFEDEIHSDDCEIILVVEDQNGNEWSYKLVKSGVLIVSMSALQGENK